jgi:RNA polymerase primary sigma factor
MEPYSEHPDTTTTLRNVFDEAAEFGEPERPEDTPEFDEASEVLSSDDPVRVYLREMGATRLLNRQGELALAIRMERGKLKLQKALSRCPLVRQNVLAMYE